jgi:ABC-type uncharacterized transport system substrate-binding protein
MKKRITSFLVGAVLLALSFPAEAQQPKKVPRIGFLGASLSSSSVRIDAFRQGLRDLGYIDGQNIAIEFRYSEGSVERMRAHAAELVKLKVDVIVANSTPATQAAKNATQTIPIVGTGTDLVGTGLIASLAHPGGNVTGLSNLNDAVGGKQLELIKEILPKVSRVAALWSPDNAGNGIWIRRMKTAAEELRITFKPLEVRVADDFEAAFSAIKKDHAGALSVLQNGVNGTNRARIFEFTTKNKLPAIYPGSEFVDAGGLMSYGSSGAEAFRRAAWYVDKILKGAKPADLPAEQPTKFEFVINLKTAKQIGLTISQSVLYRADRVIK